MRLKNKVVFINRADAHLDKGQWFIQDIIGAAVVDESGAELGKLAEVLDLPAGNVYVVRGEREIMIPAVPEFIISTDVDAGIITVRLIEGM
jgi:16S rRNA processing protein RimM